MGRLAGRHWATRAAAEAWGRKRLGDARFERVRHAVATARRYMGPAFQPFIERLRRVLDGGGRKGRTHEERYLAELRRTMVLTGFTYSRSVRTPKKGDIRRAVIRLVLMDDPDFPLTPTVMAYVGISEGIDPPATEGAFGDEWLTASEMFKRRNFQRWQNLLRPGALGLLDP